ncbi:RNA-binding protein CP33, chloroplastic [Manihot esculenta]|uniref:RRM domain-containing protein n=1 Tax=Manihot esculenta TaxID=3983 RepID=A0A2C9VFD1_MANES|nr:RNA-binding protein CP33, chloroplastic [Manihot esculenta]OAY43007.1 hypothetical protein MANES_08G034600v8 [Manihot esculenta]
MSALSMATSTFSSSPLHTKLSFTPSPLSLPSRYLSKPFKPLKLFKFNTHFQDPLFPLSPSHFHPAFAAFESSEVAHESNEEGEEAELDVEEYKREDDDDELKPTESNEEGEEAEQKVVEYKKEDDDELKPTASNEEGKIYVGNLPYSMTSSQLTEVFQEAGSVMNVEIVYDRVTDRSRGFGFVTMASGEEAKEAIRMFNGSQIGGRTVRVNFPEVPKGGEKEAMAPRIRSTYKGFIDSPHKIYAGNLGWGLTSQGLRDAFANQPGLLSAKVIYERNTGRSRGFGFVSFESAENAEAALTAMNGVEVEGRPLRLNLASERARSSPTLEANQEENLESSEQLSSIGS